MEVQGCDMKMVHMIPIEDIKPSTTNANQHDEKQLAVIADSILHFGWTYPLLITQDHVIVAGHGRYEAAKRLGQQEVPCMYIPSDWTPEDIRAYTIADNAIQERSTWDENLLSLELNDLHQLGYDVALTGFSAEDLSSYMGYDTPAYEATHTDTENSNESKQTSDKVECPRCGYKWRVK